MGSGYFVAIFGLSYHSVGDKLAEYLKNSDLLGEILKYQSTSDESIRLRSRQKLLTMFNLMAWNIATKYKNLDDDWRFDMVQEATLACIEKIEKFDPSVGSNAFSYYTSVIQTEFLHFNKKENAHKQRFIPADFYDALGNGRVHE